MPTLRGASRDSPAGQNLILDNYATHKHPNVKAWLAKHPRFRPHFTPTSSSWINMVERYFGKLTDKAMVYLTVGRLDVSVIRLK